MVSKSYHDKVHRAQEKIIEKGDWVIVKKIKKNVKVQKGESVYSEPYIVKEVSGGSVLIQDKGWWNKSDVIKLKPGKHEHITKGKECLSEDGEGLVWEEPRVQLLEMGNPVV